MAQFGHKSPGTWARVPSSNQPINAGLFQNPLIGNQTFGTSVPPMSVPGMINAFSQQSAGMGMNLSVLQGQQAIRMQQQQPPAQKSRTFTGTVTKMHDSYGFIDEDVFFQINVVRGVIPRVGDRVIVDAAYNPSMPFKWTAVRVETVTQKAPLMISNNLQERMHHLSPRGSSGGWNEASALTVQHMNEGHAGEIRGGMRMRSPPRMGAAHRSRTPPGRMMSGLGGDRRIGMSPIRRNSPQRKQISPRHSAAQRSYPKRQRSPARGEANRVPPARQLSPKRATPLRKHEPTKAERAAGGFRHTKSPSLKREAGACGSSSPPRRRARIVARYHCHMPKAPLSMMNGSRSVTISYIRKRYTSMYIPSDFIESDFQWPSATPIENPIHITSSPISFHVLHKDVECPHAGGEWKLLTPTDADARFNAKVILLGHDGLSTVHQKAFGLQPEGMIDENVDPMSIFRCINFLVGVRGKGEMTALGGPWSPSLDGQHPDKDPQVLIRTAIRTVRSLVGIDLSNCAKWYKLAQIRYYRAEKNRVDTSVLLLPCTDGVMPDTEGYEQLLTVLKKQLSTKISAIEAQTIGPVLQDDSNFGEGNTTDSAKEQTEEQLEEEDEEDDLTPTHWAELDVKIMKVAELRQELMARDLETKGIKSVLLKRLQQALEREKAIEQGEVEKVEELTDEKRVERPLTEEEKKAKEKLDKEINEQKVTLEKHFNFPKEPHVFIYPNRFAKGGKFDCKVVPFSSILNYRIDDCKEHSFELAIMAECVAEMIDRSQAFAVYYALCCHAEKEEDTKRRDEGKVVAAATPVVSREDTQETGADNEKAKDEKKDEEHKKEEQKRDEEKKRNSAEQKKSVITNRAAFQAFAHFDQNLCGYLTDKDTEDIVYSIGLNLSRAQIQKLIKKFCVRDRINYRQFTDSLINREGAIINSPKILPIAPHSSVLAKGNALTGTNDEIDSPMQPSEVGQDGTAIFNGVVMNIPSLMDKVSYAESERSSALQKICTLEALLKESAKNSTYLEKKKKRLEDDVERYRKRLHDAEKCLKNSVDDTVQMKSAIQEFKKIGQKIIAVSEKVMPTVADSVDPAEKGSKSPKREKKCDKKDVKKKEDDDVEKNEETSPEMIAPKREERELTLLDEVTDEFVDMDAIVLKEEVNGDEKEIKEEPQAEFVVDEPMEQGAEQ